MNAATDALIEAFRTGGLRSAGDTYRRMTRRGPLSRAAAAVVESVLPVTALCTALLRYDAAIGAHGIGPGSRVMLEEWGIQTRYEMHPETWRVLDDEPFLAFGNHACGLEPALFNALLARDDIHYLAGDFVTQVGPHLARLVLPLGRTGTPGPPPLGTRARALDAVERAVWPPRADFAASRANATQLARAARLISAEGAGVHLFPTGSLRPGVPWQPGTGHLVRLLLRARRAAGPGARPVHLVPVVYGIRDAHVLAGRLLGPNSPVRVAARLRLAPGDPGPYVYADAPVLLETLALDAPGGQMAAPAALAARLYALWADARANACRAIPGWRSAAAVLRPGSTR